MVLSWIYVLLSLLTPVFGKSSFPLYPDYSLSYLWHKWCRGRYPFPHALRTERFRHELWHPIELYSQINTSKNLG